MVLFLIVCVSSFAGKSKIVFFPEKMVCQKFTFNPKRVLELVFDD